MATLAALAPMRSSAGCWASVVVLLVLGGGSSPAEAQRRDQLRDHPLAGDSVRYLDSTGWRAHNDHSNMTIAATVPGDIITDLQAAGVIDDPYFNVSWRNPEQVAQWANGTWSFERTFDFPDAVPGGQNSTPSSTLLVFDGVKMGAYIAVNGVRIGVTTDQFLRYSFSIGSLLKPTGNVLRVTFDRSIDTGGRFMACTGGYDWAPFSTTATRSPSVNASLPSGYFSGGWQATFSFGMWKSVYLVSSEKSVAFTAVSAHSFYMGEYPTAPLADDTHEGFELRVQLQLNATAPLSNGGTLRVNASFGAVESRIASVPAGSSRASIVLPAQQVRLWWPRGLGEQCLYNVTISFVPAGSSASSALVAVSTVRQVGFRSLALVTR